MQPCPLPETAASSALQATVRAGGSTCGGVRQCGHIGCCDASPSQHATGHATASGHPVITSFEPGEEWFYSFTTRDYVDGVELAPPAHRPLDQPKPGPRGKVPEDWQERLH